MCRRDPSHRTSIKTTTATLYLKYIIKYHLKLVETWDITVFSAKSKITKILNSKGNSKRTVFYKKAKSKAEANLRNGK